MKHVILDTSFIISCIKQKIDFFEYLESEGMEVLIPEQTIDELLGLGQQTALNIIEKNDYELLKVLGKDADTAIIAYGKKHPETIVATLDKGLQKRIKNKKMVIRGKKQIKIL